MFKKLLPLLVLALTYPIIELHWLFADSGTQYNLILFGDPKYMFPAWNMAYIANQVIVPFMRAFAVFLMFKQLRIKGIFYLEIQLLLLYTILDGISYFLWFRSQDEYSIIYWIMAVFAAIIWCKKNNFSEPNNNKDVI